MKNTYIAGVLAALLLLAAVVYGSGLTQGQVAGSTEGPIKIGMVYGITGSASGWAEYGKNAADMAVAEINAEGGIRGRQITLIYEDSKTTPNGAVSAFQKLVSVDHVDAVIGDVWSFMTNPLIPLADASQTMLVSPTVMDKSVEQHSDYFFSVAHTLESEEEAVRTFFKVNPDIKSISLLCWDDAWGNAHAEMYKRVASERGVSVLGTVCLNDFASDYRTEMSKIKSQNPDSIMLVVAYPDIALRAYNTLGMKQKVVSMYIPDAIELRDMPRAHATNVWFVDWMANQEFQEKYRNQFGMYPILEAQNHYDALYAVAHALSENVENPSEGITSVTFQGAEGVIDFTAGDRIRANTTEAQLYRVHPVSGYTEVR